jgi:hypothetical protein
MILPRIRNAFDRSDAMGLVELLGGGDPELRRLARERLEESGIDVLLDDPRTAAAVLTDPRVNLRPALVFYVLVRNAMLEGGVDDRLSADYLASMIMTFGFGNRAWRISDDSGEEFHYLVDLFIRMGEEADSSDAFLLRSHLGNYALWLTGLFPDYVEGRRQRRGAPSYRYYESMGTAGFRSAAATSQAAKLGVDQLLREVATSFSALRVSLNRLSDRYLWRGGGDPVSRLLRELEGRVAPEF